MLKQSFNIIVEEGEGFVLQIYLNQIKIPEYKLYV